MLREKENLCHNLSPWRNIPMDKKIKDVDFFNCLYDYIQAIIQADDKYSAENLECFQKFYESMVKAFANSEDAGYINWKRMWDYLSFPQIIGSGTEGEETELSQNISAKNKDIDMFFGILYQCMMFRIDVKVDESNKTVIKNIFGTVKETFKSLKFLNIIPWDCMWPVFMNSEVYSRMVEKERKNRGGDYLGKELYPGNRRIFSDLMDEDMEWKSYSHFVCVLKSDYIGFDIPNTSGNEAMKGQKRKFEEIIRELDVEGQIEKIFTHYKEGGKRPVWEVSAVNAKDFYKRIDEERYLSSLSDWNSRQIYYQFCSEEGWKASYESIKEVIECFNEKGDRRDWYKEYKRLDRVGEILCQLVPIVSYRENGRRYIKTYNGWKEDCDKITKIVREKTLVFGIDQVEIKAAELVKNHINRLSESGYGERVQTYFKERYLEFLAEQSERLFQSFDKAYLVLKNVDNKKDMEEIAKRVIDSLEMN